MSLRLTIREAFDRNLESIAAPSLDRADVRRRARRNWRRRTGWVLLAALLLGVAAVVLAQMDPPEPLAEIDPGDLQPMDFNAGLRAFADGDTFVVGGQSFKASGVRDMDVHALPTPHGLLFFSPDQSARMLSADGRIMTLMPGLDDPAPITPSAAFDAYVPMVAWLRRSVSDGAEVVVYRFADEQGIFDTYPLPCERIDCSTAHVVAFDIGNVFLTTASGSWVLRPSQGSDAGWVPITSGTVIDVRNRVILVDGTESLTIPKAAQLPGWRMVQGETPTSMLTLEGGRQTNGTATLKPTLPGVGPLILALPEGAGLDGIRVDTDGSLLVSSVQNDGTRFYDCDLTGACAEVGFIAGAKHPVLLGVRP